MRKRLLAAAMSLGLAVTAAMPAAAFAEEASAEETTAGAEETSEEETAEAEEAYDYSAAYEENGFFKGVTALDYVTLPVYTGVRIADTDVVPTDSQIQTQIDQTLNSYSTTENVTEGIIRDGDTVNIDYVGSVDGVEFDGGSTQGNGTDVTIGVTSYIDDFLEQLIGHEPGETIDVEVTFPDEYPNNPDLAGKDAVFVTTINHIVNTIVPELNDEFVKENLEFKSAEEYRQSIYDSIYEDQLSDALISYLLENAEISEVPEAATDAVYGYQYEYISQMCRMYGMEVSDFLEYQGMTEEDLREQCEAYAKEIVILQAVMEDAGLEVTKDMVMEVVDATEEDYDSFVEFYGVGYVNNCIIPDCVANFMKESVDVYETEPETEEETEEETAAESEAESEEEAEGTSETETESVAG